MIAYVVNASNVLTGLLDISGGIATTWKLAPMSILAENGFKTGNDCIFLIFLLITPPTNKLIWMEARINHFPKRSHNATKLGSVDPPESGFLTGYKITKRRTTTFQIKIKV